MLTNKQKPKMKVIQVINKCMILWNLKTNKKTRIYYKWDIDNKNDDYVKFPCIIVDYNSIKREWHVNYISHDNDKILSATIDDITGGSSIRLFDNVN